jgi:hypothetical protein
VRARRGRPRLWSKLICFADDPALSCCEIDNFRYRVLHVAGASLEADGCCGCASIAAGPARQLAIAFERLRAAFA